MPEKPDGTETGATPLASVDLKPIVLVTGASRGIGAALAERFAEAGNDIAIVARDGAALSATASRIAASTGRNVVPVACDITGQASPEYLASELRSRGFYIETLINNAGIGLSGPFVSQEAQDLDRLIDINITAMTRLMREVLPQMLARRRGGILNVSSLGGAVPGPYQAAYYASRAYVISLTEAVAAETAGQGLRIAVLAPGPVNTTIHEAMGAESALYRRILPSHSPETVARAAYRAFILGQRVIVPGVLNRLSYLALRALPHPVSVPLMAWLLRPRR